MAIDGVKSWCVTCSDGVQPPRRREPARPEPVTPSSGTDTATLSWGARAAALMQAMDADRDGAISEDEFVDGARALLDRGQGLSKTHQGRGHHGAKRLERRLERVFDRVDADSDGAVTTEELVAALSRGKASTSPAPAPAEPTTPAATQGTTSASFVNVTFVAVAVRRYSSVSQLAQPTADPAPTLPSPAPGNGTKA